MSEGFDGFNHLFDWNNYGELVASRVLGVKGNHREWEGIYQIISVEPWGYLRLIPGTLTGEKIVKPALNQLIVQLPWLVYSRLRLPRGGGAYGFGVFSQ